MKLKNILSALLVPFNALIVFFLIFYTGLVVPSWLQVFGRMHPLMLHFPIVLLFAFAAFVFFVPSKYKEEYWHKETFEWLLLFSALTASVTALMGLLLSKEQGYDADALAWHKYLGCFTSIALFLFYNFRSWLQEHNIVSKISIAATVTVITWGSDLGGDITHGENFVMAPVTPEHKKQPPAFEDAFVYADLIEPILEAKCMSCHNSSKAKGELVMETKELLLKGGKNGKLWDTTQADLGLLMKRIHLPEEEKEHMPPSGKPQLTDREQEILYAWIKEGANFDQRVIELPPTDTLRLLAEKVLKQSAEEQYDFAAADDKEITKLTNANRVVMPLATGSPALVVNFFNKGFYSGKELEALQPVSDQIVELNLDNMPVKDEDLKTIAGFKNLRRLNLNATDITGATIADLKNLQFLKSLSLSGTKIKQDQLVSLASMQKLRTVYLWNTDVNEKDLAALEQKNKNILYQTGFKGDTMILKLTPPIILNDEQVITKAVPLQLKHYINGTTIRYTTDGKDPDSITSPIYSNNILIDTNETVKAKAFKPGWLSSDVMEYHFFKATYVADSAAIKYLPAIQYRGSGAKTLIDLDKSDLNFANGKWLGYKDSDCIVTIFFKQPVPAKSITVSMLQDINAYIFPPARIEVWGGMNEKQMKSLATLTPPLPGKDDTNKQNLALDVSFKEIPVSCIKLLIKPVYSLPSWHPGKGTHGWVFIDELFVN